MNLSEAVKVHDAMAGSGPEGQDALMQAAGQFLADPNGARIAFIEQSGYDSHTAQTANPGALGRAMRDLDRGLMTLKTSLGPAWDKTVVLVATEFGRTVAANGSGGTDHGTGSCAFVLGGAVKGEQVIADWPGLSAARLYEGRDLTPTLDIRQLITGLVSEHFGIETGRINRSVFPDMGSARPITGLVRT